MDVFSIFGKISLDSTGFVSEITNASTAIMNFARSSVSTGMQFDAAMSQVAATLGTTTSQIGNLREFAQQMGATTSFSATQAADGLNTLAMAGLNAEEQMSALPGTMNLSAAGALSLAQAASYTTGAVKGFGDSMGNVNYYADLIAKGATLANTSVAGLGEALSGSASTAASYGQKADSVTLSLLRLADQNESGAAAATALAAAMKNIYAPTEKAKKALDELRVSAYEKTTGKARDFNVVVDELNAALKDMSDQEANVYKNAIFGIQGFDAFNKMTAASAESVERFSAGLKDSAGAAMQQANTQLDNLSGKMTLMQSAVDGAKISISDALTPALKKLADVGTSAFTWVGDFAKENPVLVQGVAGAAAGVTALTASVGALTAAIKLAKVAQDTLNTSMSLIPALGIAAAVGAAVTIMASYETEADKVREKNNALIESIEKSKKAYEDTASTAEENAAKIENLKNMLYQEMDSADESAAKHERVNAIVKELNENVSGLNLAYDAQTGSLNQTNSELETYIQNQLELAKTQESIKRITELESTLKSLKEQLKNAQDTLNNIPNAYTSTDLSVVQLRKSIDDLRDKVAQTDDELKNQKEALYGTETAAYGLDDATVTLTGDVKKLDDQVKGNTESTAKAAKANDTATVSVDDLRKATNQLSDAQSDLNSALKEQEKNGSLSIKTVNSLIDSGYALALQVDSETGAVTLNKDEYIRLASAKIDAQIATLSARKEAFSSAAANRDEAAAVRESAVAWIFKKMAQKSEEASIDASIAALNKLKGALGSVTAASRSYGGGGGGGGGAAKAAKTQAEQYHEMFKADRAALDHARAMTEEAEKNDEEYYNKLEELRNKYLTDTSNSSVLNEQRKVDEEIFNGREKLKKEKDEAAKKDAEKAEKDLITSAERRIKIESSTATQQLAILENLQSQMTEGSENYKTVEGKIFDARIAIRDNFYNEAKKTDENIANLEKTYQDKLEASAKAIADTYGLFDEVQKRKPVSGDKLLQNLQAQVKTTEEFYTGLDKLKERGVGEALLSEIRAKGPKAVDELNGLLSMSDTKLQKYEELYGEKQGNANKHAADGLEDLRKETDTKIENMLTGLKKTFDDTTPSLGKTFTGALATSIEEGMSKVVSAALGVANGAVTAAGGVLGLGDMSNAGSYKTVDFASSGLGVMSAGIVNGVSSAVRESSGYASGPININLVLPDGEKLAAVTFDPLVEYGKATGRPITGEQYA